MGLKIKNREARLMAEELSKLTGESMTTAVTIALRERLVRVRQEQGLSLADRLLAIGRDCAARLKDRSVPPIMATSFMTNADYLDDRRYVRANRYPARRPQLLSKGEFCHVAKFASRAFGARRGCNNLHIQLLNCQFWQNEAKMINVFKGSHLLPTPTCASCD